jgi:hypothetical protein
MNMGVRPGMMMMNERAAAGAANNIYQPPSEQMQYQHQNMGITPGLTPTQNLNQNLNQSQYRNSLPEPLHPIPRESPNMPSYPPNPPTSLQPQPSQKKSSRLSRPSSRRTQSETIPPPQLKQSFSAQNLNPSQNQYTGQLDGPPLPGMSWSLQSDITLAVLPLLC